MAYAMLHLARMGERWFVIAALALAIGCHHTATGEGQEDGGPVGGGDDGGISHSDAGPDGDTRPPEAPLVAVSSGTASTLRGVWMSADASLAIAVGEGGAVVRSEDGGK